MAAIIKVRTISAATETAIQLPNGTFARPINIGTGWNTIRVGIRVHMDNTGAALGSGNFFIGLCSGNTNQFGDATTTHAVGCLTTSSFQFQTTFYNATGFAPAKRVGSTLTTGTVLAANAAIPCKAASNTADRAMISIDIIKGSPNYSFQLFAPNNTVPADMSAASFLTLMEATTPASTSYVFSSAQTLAVNQATDGTLDNINISWDHSSPWIEICDIAVARIA